MLAGISLTLVFFKINVNGSNFNNPRRFGFGGVARDHMEQWLLGFCYWIGEASNLLAELLAIYNGLRLGWQQGWRNVVCESDSLKAVDLNKKADLNFHSYAGVIWDIRVLLHQDWQVEIVHILREANHVADFLTKMGAKSNHHCQVLSQAPHEISSFLAADAISLAFPRA